MQLRASINYRIYSEHFDFLEIYGQEHVFCSFFRITQSNTQKIKTEKLEFYYKCCTPLNLFGSLRPDYSKHITIGFDTEKRWKLSGQRSALNK
jgi:hypothetical protein